MFDLRPRSNFDGILAPGHFGRAETTGITISELCNLEMTAILARKGQDENLRAVVKAQFGLELPATPRRIGNDQLAFIWAGPLQWLAISQQPLQWAGVAPYAALSAQGDGRAVLRISGPKLREILRKGVNIDLHPRAFGTGDAALTSISHISAMIWQLNENTFDISVPRSFAGSFWHWLSASAAEFGYEILSR